VYSQRLAQSWTPTWSRITVFERTCSGVVIHLWSPVDWLVGQSA
jgi:hypothetical protein